MSAVSEAAHNELGDGKVVATLTFTSDSDDGKYTDTQVLTALDCDIAFHYETVKGEASIS